MSLFSVVHDSGALSLAFNNELLKICQWHYQWKIIFNPHTSKQVQEVAFSSKSIATNNATVYFYNFEQLEKTSKIISVCFLS